MKVSAVPKAPAFKPYTIEIEVQTREEHDALNYAGMCTTVIPDALRKKARSSINQ